MYFVIEIKRDDSFGEPFFDWITVLKTLSPQGKTSMLQDMEAGFKTEVDIFCEKVVNLGQTHNIPTPVNQTILRIIRILELNRS